jgi:carboxyl-terminal processing protease
VFSKLPALPRRFRVPFLALGALLLLGAGPLVEAAESQQRPAPQFTPFGGAVEQDRRGGGASEEAEVFLSTLRVIRDFGLSTYTEDELWEKAIEGLLRELDDPYATVLSRREAQAFEEESTGNYAGIGVQITELNGVVTITAVFRGTPADREGLLVGDRIVGVDGDDARSWTVEDASNRIRGEPGTEVRVIISRDGIAQPIPHQIRRERVHIPAVTAERIFGDIEYVLVDRVARNSAAEVDSVLQAMDGSRGLILDLRGNPGGYLDESLRMADLFLERGDLMVSTKARRPGQPGEPGDEPSFARMAPRVPDVPVIVLVNGFSASASEIVAGALQDHDRALVMGERTFGKGSVQSVVPLPAGRLMRITSGEWYTPLGRSLNRVRDREGRVIQPDTIDQFVTPAGRRLLGGGGVAPDLEIRPDTLTTLEQRFIAASAEAEIPLAQRIQEAAFAVAQEVRAGADLPDAFPPAALRTFLQGLQADGLPSEALNPETEAYLGWRLEVALYQRLERADRALETQSARDPALATAIRLLQASGNQAELFARAAEAGGPPAPPEGAVVRQAAAGRSGAAGAGRP